MGRLNEALTFSMVFWWWYLKKGVVVSSKLVGRSSEGLVALEELAVSWFVDSDMF